MTESILNIVLTIGATIIFIALHKLIMALARWIEADLEEEEE